MVEFIIKNKEWLFSGIGVFLIAGVFALLKVLLKKKRQASSKPFPSTDRGLDSGNPYPTTASVVRSEKISPDGIRSAYCSVPLLQRPDVARQYHGLRVKWEGNLYSVEMMSNGKAKIEIKWADSTFGIFFTVDSSKYEGLGILERGDILTVEGRIEDVSEFYISLADVKLVPEAEHKGKENINMGEEDVLIMEAIKNIASPDDALATKDISEIVGMDIPTTEYFLNRLKSFGIVNGPYIMGVGQHYMLTEKGFQVFYEIKK